MRRESVRVHHETHHVITLLSIIPSISLSLYLERTELHIRYPRVLELKNPTHAESISSVPSNTMTTNDTI